MAGTLIVGYYPKPFKPEYKEVNLDAILRSFSSDYFKNAVSIARDLYDKKEFEKYTLLKNTLPAITFSVIFAPSRSAINVQKYSSLIVMDIDKIGKNIHELKIQLSNDPYVLAAWLSPSGDGLKFLIKNGLSQSDHKKIYKEQLSITVPLIKLR